MLNTTRTAELSFHINQEIGHEGKNSEVFIATDLQLDAEIVVKKYVKINLMILMSILQKQPYCIWATTLM